MPAVSLDTGAMERQARILVVFLQLLILSRGLIFDEELGGKRTRHCPIDELHIYLQERTIFGEYIIYKIHPKNMYNGFILLLGDV